MNTFGTLFRLTTFGESHGPGIGGIIDGMPAGIPVDLDFIQSELNRRKPGQSALTTPRKENDCVELLSGVFDGRTTGCPIGFLVRNENQHWPTTTICAMCSAHRTLTLLTKLNMVSAITGVADEVLHAKLLHAWWEVPLPKWC